MKISAIAMIYFRKITAPGSTMTIDDVPGVSMKAQVQFLLDQQNQPPEASSEVPSE